MPPPVRAGISAIASGNRSRVSCRGGRRGHARVPPRAAVEQGLVEIWERSLQVTPVGTTDDFFDLGGDSLTAVRVFSRIEAVFGKTLSIATLFQSPTIAALADRILEQFVAARELLSGRSTGRRRRDADLLRARHRRECRRFPGSGTTAWDPIRRCTGSKRAASMTITRRIRASRTWPHTMWQWSGWRGPEDPTRSRACRSEASSPSKWPAS